MIKHQMNVVRLPLFIYVFIASLTLTACGGNADNQPGGETANESASGSGGAATTDSDSPSIPVSDLPNSSNNPSGPDGAPELGFALGNPNLKATDPTTVLLASGQNQVLEFFAFW